MCTTIIQDKKITFIKFTFALKPDGAEWDFIVQGCGIAYHYLSVTQNRIIYLKNATSIICIIVNNSYNNCHLWNCYTKLILCLISAANNRFDIFGLWLICFVTHILQTIYIYLHISKFVTRTICSMVMRDSSYVPQIFNSISN